LEFSDFENFVINILLVLLIALLSKKTCCLWTFFYVS